MADDAAIQARLERLSAEDAIGQLRRQDGLMAALGSEDGALKLDWVEGVARLLADPTPLAEVEAEARAIRDRGIRHIIWAGMGGSVLTVRVLRDLGFCGGDGSSAAASGQVTIHPLDSTDPAALNAIVRVLAAGNGLPLPIAGEPQAPAYLQALLGDVLMVGVAMGMTSEEPITHLTWFTDLLEQAGLPPSDHLLVMTLPGSYLDSFAREHHAPSRPLQLDGGNGTGGRRSAPTTRVFLLPAALYRMGKSDEPGRLRAVLQAAWDEYDLDLAATRPAEHPFARLAATLSAASREGACRMLLHMPAGWQSLVAWLEQLMEESLGKGGKGIVVFADQPLNESAPGYTPSAMLRVVVTDDADAGATQAPGKPSFTLTQPSLARTDPQGRLAALAASFLGWQLTMALYGYLEQIPFAGQPAVENYKTRARALRGQPDPLQVAGQWRPASHDGPLTLLAPAGTGASAENEAQPAVVFARALREARATGSLGYLDVTVNGEAPAALFALLDERAHTLGNALLGVPVKLRPAPASYHSTEQSEMDGPPDLVSLRLVARETEPCLLGEYTTAFLHAQAVSTWQAMMEAGRPCYLLVIAGSLADAGAPLATFFAGVERGLVGM
jgi:glucose-6-phosphate isomerase